MKLTGLPLGWFTTYKHTPGFDQEKMTKKEYLDKIHITCVFLEKNKDHIDMKSYTAKYTSEFRKEVFALRSGIYSLPQDVGGCGTRESKECATSVVRDVDSILV